MMSGRAHHMAQHIVLGIQLIGTAAEIVQEVSIRLRVERSPAGEIHVDADTVLVELFNMKEQFAGLRDTEIVPCGSRGVTQAGHPVGIRKEGAKGIALGSGGVGDAIRIQVRAERADALKGAR